MKPGNQLVDMTNMVPIPAEYKLWEMRTDLRHKPFISFDGRFVFFYQGVFSEPYAIRDVMYADEYKSQTRVRI